MKTQNIHEHLVWTEVQRERIADGHVFDLIRSRRRSQDGREADYYVIESSDWANIIALTPDEEGRECFVMVRQFRQGANQVCLEFPGGVVDAGEGVEEAIVRELREETGYEATEVAQIGALNPNPALFGNTVYTYFARNVTPVAKQELDANEIIDVALIPVADLLDGHHEHEFHHAIMVAALSFYLRMSRRG